MAPPAAAKPADAERRPVVAIPLQFPRSQRQSRSENEHGRKEAPTRAKSEKSDTTSGDERHAVKAIFEHPMTPESLPSSIHKADEIVTSSQEDGPLLHGNGSVPQLVSQPNGATSHAVSMPPLKPQLPLRSAQSTETDTTNGLTRNNEQEHKRKGSNREIKTGKPRTRSLRVLHEPPPEFHPSSEPSSTPLSGDQSTMRLPSLQTYSPMNGFHDHGHHYAGTARPVSFNPEANFQPLDRTLDMSRTPSHSSSLGRPTSGDPQSPMIPQTLAPFHDPNLPSAIALQGHVVAQFGKPALSDITLDISGLATGTRLISAHTLVLYRSPALRHLIDNVSASDRTIYIHAPNRFMTEYGFVPALKYLYGAPVLTPDDIIPEMNQAPVDIDQNGPAARIMAVVLDYIASGYFLGMPDVVGAGLGCARVLQRWDTVPTCLSFALDGGTGHWWRAHSDREEEMIGLSQEPTFGDAAGQLLDSTLEWIVMALPVSFQLNTAATQLRELPRLPTMVESRPSQADPRLSLIQFGEMSVEDSGRPDFLTTFISSILLSLPFLPLKFVLEHPAFSQKFGKNSLQLAEAVVNEREHRRSKVLQVKRMKDKHLWGTTQWQEQVKIAQNFPGYQIFRKRVAGGETNSGT